MNILNQPRLCKVEKVVATLEVTAPILEAFTAKGRFIQLVGLDHRPHGAIDDCDALPKELLEFTGYVWSRHNVVQNRETLPRDIKDVKSRYHDALICN